MVCRECKKADAIGKLPYCADCLINLDDTYHKKYQYLSLWCMCAELNIPYIHKYATRDDGPGQGQRHVGILTYLNLCKDNNIEGTFADSDRHMFQLVQSLTEQAEAKEKEDKYNAYEKRIDKLTTEIERLEAENADLREHGAVDEVDYDKAVRLWGDGYDEQEYAVLDDIFNAYTCEIDKLTPPMRFRYQDLAKLELRRRQLGSNADAKESKTISDEIIKLYQMLGLENFEAAQKTDEERLIDRICWEIENTQPAEVEDLNKYQDFSGFKKPLEHIMRCVNNVVAGNKDFPTLRKVDADE